MNGSKASEISKIVIIIVIVIGIVIVIIIVMVIVIVEAVNSPMHNEHPHHAADDYCEGEGGGCQQGGERASDGFLPNGV